MAGRYERFSHARIQLPEMHVFFVPDHRRSPLHVFLRWVAEKSGGCPRGAVINPSGILLHPQDMRALVDEAVAWAVKVYRYNNTEARNCVGWLNMDVGPVELTKDEEPPEWLEPGYVYIDADDLFLQPTRRQAP